MTTEITRDLLKALRADINAALVAAAEKHGLILQVGNASFSADAATFKLGVAIKHDGAPAGQSVSQAKAIADWNALHGLYDMKKEWLGVSFPYAGKQVKIIGLMPNRRKFPILVSTNAGRDSLLPSEAVAGILSRAGA